MCLHLLLEFYVLAKPFCEISQPTNTWILKFKLLDEIFSPKTLPATYNKSALPVYNHTV